MHGVLSIVWLRLACLGFLVVLLAASRTAGAEPQRVLLFHSFGRDFSPFTTFSAVLRTELVNQSPEPMDVFEVSLESARFRNTVQEAPLVDYLPALFSGRQPTFWELHRWWIAGVVLLCFLQAALIIRLLFKRAKRRQGEAMATLTAELSSKFINLPPGEVDREVEDAQRRVCECLGLDLSALWQWTDETPRYLRLTHLYRPLGGPPTPERFDSREAFPWCLGQLLDEKIVLVSSMESLPPEAALDKERWQYFGIKSNVTFPLSTGGGQIVGALSFNTTRGERAWPEEIVKRLQIVAQIFANSLARKRADQELRESEARLSLAADSAGAGLWGLDLASGNYWLTNRTREILHFSPDQVMTFDIVVARVHPEDQAAVRQIALEVMHSGGEASLEFRIVLPNGGVRWISSRGRARHHANGKPDYVMGVVVDVTARKQAEEAFCELQTTLNEILDSTGDMIWSVDPNSFGLMSFNRSCRDYFLQKKGIRLERGMRPEDLSPAGEYIQQWRGFYQRALQEGPFTTEYQGDEHGAILLLSFSVVKRDGKVLGVSAFGKDVTEQKIAEREAHELRSSLAHSGRVTLLGQLASALAHELSQPLGAILRNAETAELMLQTNSPDLAELRAIVTDILKDNQRAGSVIDRLRSLLKRRSLDVQPVELNGVVGEVLSLVRADAAARRIKLRHSATPRLPRVQGDRIHLQQVLLNLLINAMDAMSGVAPNERSIQVAAQRTDAGNVEVRVFDNGPGIPDEFLGRVFEPFFTTKANGMGLGLAVSKTIVEAHHGRIWAENRPERGACFCFTLPVADDRKTNGE